MKLPIPSLFLAITVWCASIETHAALVPIAARSALGMNADSVDWLALGPEFATPSNPFAITSADGLNLTVSKASAGPFERVDEGGFGWLGNFTVGDALLWASLTPGPLTIDFGTGVLGAGLQIQNDALGAFTATVEAFDASNVSLGAFSFNGNSTQAEDGSAIFVGVLGTTADVRRITFDVSGSSSFAVNRVSIAAAVPEPGTALGAGMACLFLIGSRRRAGETPAKSAD